MAGIPLTKRALIDKTNTTIVIIVSIAAFVSVFSLVATKTLVSQIAYQNRVISDKRAAVKQLTINNENMDKLKVSYNAFTGSTSNVLDGISTGIGPKDGDNAKIVLDALPNVYDFPATVASVQVLAASNGTLSGISGTDNEVQEASNRLSATPNAVQIPFDMTSKGNYQQLVGLISALQRSIRPIEVQTLDVTGESGELNINIKAATYYQPGKSLAIKTKVVK
ncbi:MAG: hypothetical protein WAS36_03265 [Candidatus Saccharimonadales bacterium]